MGTKGKLRGAVDGVPFTKNDPRINKKGRPAKLPDLDELMREVLGEEQHGKTAMQMILLALRQRAMKGDVRCAELLMDRGYGKLVSKKDIDLNMELENLSESQLIGIANHLFTKSEENGSRNNH